jgi:hypothetical protein
VESPLLQARRPTRPARRPIPPPPAGTGGADGNERLTAGAAALLFVLLAVEGVTIVFVRPLLSVHVFVGMLLIPPVALKLGSTGYRFARYYSRNRDYLAKGPPHPLMRFLVAPVLVVATVGVFATGVAILALGQRHGFVVGLHKASFVVWFGAMGIHVLVYMLRLPRLIRAELRRRQVPTGAILRSGLLAGAIAAGAVLAVATYPLARPLFRHRGDNRSGADAAHGVVFSRQVPAGGPGTATGQPPGR